MLRGEQPFAATNEFFGNLFGKKLGRIYTLVLAENLQPLEFHT